MPFLDFLPLIYIPMIHAALPLTLRYGIMEQPLFACEADLYILMLYICALVS